MTTIKQSLDTVLPWSSSRQEDKQFTVIVILCLLSFLAAMFFLQMQDLPKPDRKKMEKLPPQLAKVILKKKELIKAKPKPKLKPKVKPKPKPKAKPKPKVEEKPKPKPKPKVKKKAKPKPLTKKASKEAVKKAKAKAQKLVKQLDSLNSLRDAFKTPTNKNLVKGGSKAVTVNRKRLMGDASATSGGIQTAAVPTASGLGDAARQAATQVDSIALGNTQVAATEESRGAESEQDSGKFGRRSEESIRAVFDQNKGALYTIYNRALRKDPTLEGRVVFALVIEPDGSVSTCTIVSSALGNARLERKLVLRIKRINFGAKKVSKTKAQLALDFLPTLG